MKSICFKKIALFLLLIVSIINGAVNVQCYFKNSPEEVLRIQEFLKKNSNTLSEENKLKFNNITEKLEGFEAISQEELDFIRECERNAIRGKLGDTVFEEYSKLIKKRATTTEFTPDERFRLLEIERQIIK